MVVDGDEFCSAVGAVGSAGLFLAGRTSRERQSGMRPNHGRIPPKNTAGRRPVYCWSPWINIRETERRSCYHRAELAKFDLLLLRPK